MPRYYNTIPTLVTVLGENDIVRNAFADALAPAILSRISEHANLPIICETSSSLSRQIRYSVIIIIIFNICFFI